MGSWSFLCLLCGLRRVPQHRADCLPAVLCQPHPALLCHPRGGLHAQGHCLQLSLQMHYGRYLNECDRWFEWIHRWCLTKRLRNWLISGDAVETKREKFSLFTHLEYFRLRMCCRLLSASRWRWCWLLQSSTPSETVTAASTVCVCAGRRAERSRGSLLQPLSVLFSFSDFCLLQITLTVQSCTILVF